jgi:hypothetical protein
LRITVYKIKAEAMGNVCQLFRWNYFRFYNVVIMKAIDNYFVIVIIIIIIISSGSIFVVAESICTR